MPSNKTLVGHAWPAATFSLDAGSGETYARATDDANPRYHGPTAVAPPMAVVTATIPHGVIPVCCDENLIVDVARLMRLLHAEEDIRWHGILRPGDAYSVRTTLVGLDEKPSGEFLNLHTSVVAPGDVTVAESNSLMFIRERNPNAPKRDDAHREPAPHVVPTESVHWTVAADQSVRYAEASGDHNPIHTDDAAAQAGGLRGKILHGLCTMAFAQRAVVDRFASGESERLKRLRVRFARPVYMGDTLTCGMREAQRAGERRMIELVVKNQDGHAVLTHGMAELG